MIPVHPLAEIFPALDGPAFEELKADISAHGLREPISLWRGAILDGRNRYRALIDAGLLDGTETAGDIAEPPPGMAWRWQFFENRNDLAFDKILPFVISKNLRRRHLDESQRALVAARIANFGHGGARGPAQAAREPGKPLSQEANRPLEPQPPGAADPASPPAQPAVTIEAAAATLNVSPRAVKRARKLLEEAPPEVIAEVERGETAVSAAVEIVEQARAEVAAQEQGGDTEIDAEIDEFIDSAPVPASSDPDADAIAAAYARIKGEREAERARRIAEKKARRAAREVDLGAKISAANAALGAMIGAGRRYGVILADPEWAFETYGEGGMDRSAENHYPCSPTEAIMARPVGELAADDAVLLLWATAPMLPDALAVMAAWGFAYKSHAIWAKDRPGTGYWLRNMHELLLVGTRGRVPAPAPGTQLLSLVSAPRAAHSEKPDFAHRFAEEFYPAVPKLELNARAAREGWDIWGAEAPCDPVQLAAGQPQPNGAPEAAATRGPVAGSRARAHRGAVSRFPDDDRAGAEGREA